MDTPAPSGFPPDLAGHLLDAVPWRPGRLAVLGLAGVQGSGKSTLAAQLVGAARAGGRRAAALSLDDVYLTAGQRRHLAATVHPLLATRGPPGTHDLALLHAVLDGLAAGRAVGLPRFDKLADDRLPESRWPAAGPGLELLVLEGWMLGARPQDGDALAVPVNALERTEDADGRWRRWCNAQLAAHYPALWARLDRLVLLQPPGWEVVRRWRGEQEAALAARTGRPGMTDAALKRFIAHYERVGRQLLADLPDSCDLCVELDAQRRVRALRQGRGRLTPPGRSPAG